ncbi:MAG: cyclomaltodextrinase N-terminal domain-containing protein, partial [Bacteroidia bacterium]
MKTRMLKCWLVAMGCFLAMGLVAQTPKMGLYRVDPPFWWVGMANSKLELIVKGDGVGKLEPKLDYPGVRLEQVGRAEEDDYLFLDLEISVSARPGILQIQLLGGKQPEVVQ